MLIMKCAKILKDNAFSCYCKIAISKVILVKTVFKLKQNFHQFMWQEITSLHITKCWVCHSACNTIKLFHILISLWNC